MQADDFYQINSDEAIPLILLTPSAFVKVQKELTPFERISLIAQQFEGALGDVGILSNHEGKPSRIFIGTSDNDRDALALASVVNALAKGCYVVEQTLSQNARLAWSLAQYQFDKYKVAPIASRRLVLEEDVLKETVAEASAIFLVRDLINTPTNDLNPEALSKTLAHVAEAHGAEFKEWVGDALLRDNFPAIHAVGRAAVSAPRLLSLVWGDEKHPKVTLIGKGVCFDSGGLDIKPSAGMRLMKKDMGGAAHVIGLAQWLMTHKVPIRLQVFIPAVENSVDALAYRPGDVLTMRNGLKVEIHNTDAEGRLVLADALVKACEDSPELIIDFATLTGAGRVALGTDIAAMFTNDDALAMALSESAKKTNDPLWRMPLFDDYVDLYRSTIADCSNASESPYGGAITAALFLQSFITPNLPWVHFDIMAWNLSTKPGKPEGGEAMAMRAVGDYLRTRYCIPSRDEF